MWTRSVIPNIALFVSLCCFFGGSLFAQTSIGPALGANISTMSKDISGETSYKLSAQGGFVLEVKSGLVDSFNLYFQNELFYFQRAEKFELSNVDQTIIGRYQYLDFAPNIKVGFGNVMEAFVLVGPRVGWLMSGQVGYEANGVREMQSLNQTYTDWQEVYYPWEIGVQGGLGLSMDLIMIHLPSSQGMPTKPLSQISPLVRQGHLFVNLLYYRSLTDIYRETNSAFNVLYFNIGYLYRIPERTPDFFR